MHTVDVDTLQERTVLYALENKLITVNTPDDDDH